jgi:2,5-diketo-D-gluconate reductase A
VIWTLIRPKQAAVEAALFEGVRAVDAASIYGTEREGGRAVRTSGLGKQVLVTTKLPPAAFSDLRGAVGRSLDALGSGMEKPLVVLHSPLAPKAERLQAYERLLEAQAEGLCAGVGVANWGVTHLEALAAAGLPSPALLQLELSPFNQRAAIVSWARAQGSAVQAATWSRLSGKTGARNWGKLKAVAQRVGCTPQQALIAWSLARGFAVAPRALAGSPAVHENAPAAVSCPPEFLSQLRRNPDHAPRAGRRRSL